MKTVSHILLCTQCYNEHWDIKQENAEKLNYLTHSKGYKS